MTDMEIRTERLRQIKGVIFDCDGVLFDSLESNKRYYNSILAHLGLGPMNPEQERFVHMHVVQAALDFIVPASHKGEVEAARQKVDYFTEIMPFLTPEPGIFELLDQLRDVGIRLAVSTNRTTTMDRLAWRFGLHRYFFPIMTAHTARPKPHPEGVHHILRAWGIDPATVAFVGDSDLDEATARAAGVTFWAYRNPNLNAAMHVSCFWALALDMQLRQRSKEKWLPRSAGQTPATSKSKGRTPRQGNQ